MKSTCPGAYARMILMISYSSLNSASRSASMQAQGRPYRKPLYFCITSATALINHDVGMDPGPSLTGPCVVNFFLLSVDYDLFKIYCKYIANCIAGPGPKALYIYTYGYRYNRIIQYGCCSDAAVSSSSTTEETALPAICSLSPGRFKL